jgi:AraC-like DNA-binding protein
MAGTWEFLVVPAVDANELLQFRLSSAPFAASGQLDAFIEVWGRKMMRFEIEPLGDQPLRIDATLRSLPNFAMASGLRSPMRVHRSAELIDNDDLHLVVIAQGTGELRQQGRVATISAGEAVLTDNGTPAIFVMPTQSHTITYRFSRDLLRHRIANLDDIVARPFPSDHQVLRLLIGYAGVLGEQSALSTAELRSAVSGHMHDLAALLFSAGAAAPLADGLRAARLKAMKDDIFRRLADSSLSVGEIARSQQISERYIRQLFADDGTTFTDFVRDARLARAHRILTDVSEPHRPINAIAYECGFNDLSYFNRVFRQRYGMTPSEARGAAKHGGGPF